MNLPAKSGFPSTTDFNPLSIRGKTVLVRTAQDALPAAVCSVSLTPETMFFVVSQTSPALSLIQSAMPPIASVAFRSRPDAPPKTESQPLRLMASTAPMPPIALSSLVRVRVNTDSPGVKLVRTLSRSMPTPGISPPLLRVSPPDMRIPRVLPRPALLPASPPLFKPGIFGMVKPNLLVTLFRPLMILSLTQLMTALIGRLIADFSLLNARTVPSRSRFQAVTMPFLIWTALSQTFWNPRRSGANTRSRIQFHPAPSLARIEFHALTAIFFNRIATRHRIAKNRCHG